MKKMLVTLLILGSWFGGNAYAGSCEVPKILKTGKIYEIATAIPVDISGKVLEIDDDSCWFKWLILSL